MSIVSDLGPVFEATSLRHERERKSLIALRRTLERACLIKRPSVVKAAQVRSRSRRERTGSQRAPLPR